MEYHDVANLFPLMDGQEFEALCRDIAANGLIEPIWTYQGKILDGRNRQRACDAVGIIPQYREYLGSEPLKFSLSLNLSRRHLNETQRAGIAAKLANMPSHRPGNKSANLPTYVSQPEAAEMLNVSERTLRTYKNVAEKAPELVPLMESGELSANKAWTETRRKETIENLTSPTIQEAKEIAGVYDVIVIDPPWPMQKIEREVAPNQVGLDYQTMSIDEIYNLDIPCADDCHIFLWTTHKFLPSAFAILDNWRMSYVCTFVWHKPGGFQPFNLPMYNCEFVLYAHRGNPKFVDFKDFMVCFNAARGEHSEKPEEFYSLLRRVTAGRRLDMFNRRKIDGFDGWGKEAK